MLIGLAGKPSVGKIYKHEYSDNISMPRGDLKRSPDESFSVFYFYRQKVYKLELSNSSRMFPSDLTRSLDVFLLMNFLNLRGRF